MSANIDAKKESFAMQPHGKSVFVHEKERRCVNCAYFQQYYAPNAGNVYGFVSVPLGRCLITGKYDKRALCGACKHFGRRESN